MSFVPRLFNSTCFVRALNLPPCKSPNVQYSKFAQIFGYVSIGLPTNQLPKINYLYLASTQRFYSHKADGTQTGKIAQYDEDGSEIIYVGKFKSRIIRVKLFSLTTSVMGVAAQPILLEKGMEMGGKGLAAFLCSLAGIFTFVTPVLLHFVTKKYVINITHDQKIDEYTATTVSFFLLKNQVLSSMDKFNEMNHYDPFHFADKIQG